MTTFSRQDFYYYSSRNVNFVEIHVWDTFTGYAQLTVDDVLKLGKVSIVGCVIHLIIILIIRFRHWP